MPITSSCRAGTRPKPAPHRHAPRRGSNRPSALDLMPHTTPREKRDKAIFALLCLTGVCVGALISLRIKHVDLAEKSVTQNPREVATKFCKSLHTFFAKASPKPKPH